MKFVLDENHNRHEALDKEGVEALLAQAIQEGQLPSVDEDTAFVTMLKDPITGVSHKIVMCTQAQYNAMEQAEELIANAYYFITDDTTAEDLEAHLVQNDTRVSSLEDRADGLEARERHFVGNVTPAQGLEGLLELCYSYWANGGDSRECYGSIVGNYFYFKEGANESHCSFTGARFGKATRDIGGTWTIDYLATEEELDDIKAKTIDPTATITEAGLYAVTYATDGNRTFMLSIPDTSESYVSERHIYNTSVSSSYVVFYYYEATYNPSSSGATSGTIKIHKHDTGDSQITPSAIRLVAKY